jgi:hypothetical protein
MRRNHRQHTPKLTALILIPLIALAILGISYSHWQEILTITGTVTTGKWGLTIGSDKVVKPVGYDENRSITDEILPGNQTLHLICHNISHCWHIWVGLVIHNEGILPTTVKEHTIQITGATGYEQNFTITTYYYGPYNDGEFVVVWGGVKMDDLPFPGNQTLPIPLNPGQTAITWTDLKFNSTDPTLLLDPVHIYITIRDDIIT